MTFTAEGNSGRTRFLPYISRLCWKFSQHALIILNLLPIAIPNIFISLPSLLLFSADLLSSPATQGQHGEGGGIVTGFGGLFIFNPLCLVVVLLLVLQSYIKAGLFYFILRH